MLETSDHYNKISIHAPREGGDLEDIMADMDGCISIHAPREGGDFQADGPGLIMRDFNPRPPRGGRPSRSTQSWTFTTFQSTPPARGATAYFR